ncbi:hypothetical protein SAMN06265795_10364 [Noviherbaspirillum humi]|uniref:Uncharacterized protein n=1 Tax=Noviherbaspirillum humi TaxID=1688639 RepID=A0A239EXF6_9BURK|nr:hypothetical protein [Noviherbaspirillum humi]SNS49267.1 hypothetical protein SAMN06265795_10364 [Noviherbaspirillum humi]
MNLALADAALSTRYGLLQTVVDAQSGRGQLIFNGKPVFVTSTAAAAYRLVPAPAQGSNDFAVMEEQLPDASCAYRHTLIRIGPERQTTVTPPFGACMRLSGTRPAPQGVEVITQGSDQREHVYFWRGTGPVRESVPTR